MTLRYIQVKLIELGDGLKLVSDRQGGVKGDFQNFGLCNWMLGFSGGSVVKNPPARAGDNGFNPWVRKIPWRMKGNQLQSFTWEISWTEEPGGQQSMGCKRVGHNLATEQQQLDVK